MPDLPSVLLLYNLPREDARFAESDAGVLEEVQAVRLAMGQMQIPHRVAGIRRLADLPAVLAMGHESVVFNLVESLAGPMSDCNLVPAVCRSFGKACTGNTSQCLATTLDKWQTKALLASSGLSTPPAVVVPPGQKLSAKGLFAGPYIVKPACTDASEGITAQSVIGRSPGGKKAAVSPLAALHKAIARIHAMHQPALVERYIEGRELNVSVLEMDGQRAVMPLAEIDFSALPGDGPLIVDYSAKWHADSFAFSHTPRIIPAPLPPRVAKLVREQALAAFEVLGCRDYVRVDFRLDRKLQPMILEINANPDISPDAGFAAALAAGQVHYDHFVAKMIENAARRLAGSAVPVVSSMEKTAPTAPARTAASPQVDPAQCTIRHTQPSDRAAIVKMLIDTKFFRPDEILIAEEVLDEALAKGPGGHYQSYAVCQADSPLGWVCFGPTACTIGTYDLYWIVVDPSVQARGLGKTLVRCAEKLLRAQKGRVMVIETSGRDIYVSTRRFYLRCGYHESARLPDFYAEGDDKVVYLKFLQEYPE